MQIHGRRKSFMMCAALAILLLPGLIACTNVIESSGAANSNSDSNNNGASMEEQQNRPTNASIDPRLVSANTRFGIKLYGEVLKQNAGKNVFVSGSSGALALAMTYNGAEAETKQAMARALEVQGMSAE